MCNRLILTTFRGVFAALTLCFSTAKADEKVAIAHDSVSVAFSLGRSAVDPAFDGNGPRIDSLCERINSVTGNIKRIEVVGGTSPDGSVKINRTLSHRRAKSLIQFIGNRVELSDSLATFKYLSRDWRGLRSMVLTDPDVPCRAKVLAFLDEIIAAGDEPLDSRYLERLKLIGRGTPYIYMYCKIFPSLRRSVLYVDYETSSATTIDDESRPVSEPIPPTLTLSPTPPIFNLHIISDLQLQSNNFETYKPRHSLALKTNLIYYLALMPNLGIEWLFSDYWSVAAEGNIAWWSKDSSLKSYRIAIFDAELRRWIKPREPWHGFYVGTFVGGGIYDFENGDHGYQGEGYMAGVSCGYMWPISRNLSFETGLGAGYLYTHAREYAPFQGHYVYQRTKAINYFGPLKLYFSVVWRFLDRNKSKQHDLQL